VAQPLLPFKPGKSLKASSAAEGECSWALCVWPEGCCSSSIQSLHWSPARVLGLPMTAVLQISHGRSSLEPLLSEGREADDS
jgi:hypothetical protein